MPSRRERASRMSSTVTISAPFLTRLFVLPYISKITGIINGRFCVCLEI